MQGSLVGNFQEAGDGRGILAGEHPVGRGQALGQNLQQAFEILPGHGEIHIVIPGDKAAVTDGSEHRSAHHVVGDILFYANLVEDLGYTQQDSLKFLHGLDRPEFFDIYVAGFFFHRASI